MVDAQMGEKPLRKRNKKGIMIRKRRKKKTVVENFKRLIIDSFKLERINYKKQQRKKESRIESEGCVKNE